MDPSNYHLMEYPLKVRNIIYSYALSFEHRLIRRKLDTDLSPLALLQTSRAVEREAAPIFYELNVFHFNYRDFDIPDDYFDIPAHDIEGLLNPCHYTCNDPQPTFRYLNFPMRYIRSLRSLSLTKFLQGAWPNGSIVNRALHGDDLDTIDLSSVYFLLKRKELRLKYLSIEFSRQRHVGSIEWDEDPSKLLRELDCPPRIWDAFMKLAKVKCLQVWKTRVATRLDVSGWNSGEEGDWKPIQPEAFDRIRQYHFPRASAVLYTRTRECKPNDTPPWYFSEGFSINLL